MNIMHTNHQYLKKKKMNEPSLTNDSLLKLKLINLDYTKLERWVSRANPGPR